VAQQPLQHEVNPTAAYVIYERRDETDEEKSHPYSKLVVPQIREFGGDIVTARGKVHILEGEWQPKQLPS